MAIRHQKHRGGRDPFPAPPISGLYQKIAMSFIGLTVVIVLAALWFSSVRATVWITPSRESTPINVSMAITRSHADGALYGRVVQGVFERVQEFQVTKGDAKKVTGISMGTVRITNTNSQPQALVKTTRLLTNDERLYRISENVTVPAKGTIDVKAYADETGPTFDFTNKQKFTIPGLSDSMQKLVYAESVTPFTGGERNIRVFTQEDADASAKVLQDAILEEAKKTLRANIGEASLSEGTYRTEIVDKNTSATIGDETDAYLMSMKLNVTGVFYAKQDLNAAIQSLVEKSIPKDRKLATAGEAMKLSFEVKDVDAANEKANINVTAEVLTKRISAEGLVDKAIVLGQPISDAQRLIEKINGVESAEIIVKPSWVRRLPTLKDHVTIKVR